MLNVWLQDKLYLLDNYFNLLLGLLQGLVVCNPYTVL